MATTNYNIADITRLPDNATRYQQDSEIIDTVNANNIIVDNALQGLESNKQSKSDNTLNTTAKTVVGAINEHETDISTLSTNLEQKAEQINSLDAEVDTHKADNANKAHGGYKGVLIRNTAIQSISNDVFTILNYNNTLKNTGNFIIGTDKITIPKGVSKIQIRATLAWSTNSNGDRRLTVYKNGVNESRLGRDTRMATNTVATEVSFNSIVEDVTEGDYYQIAVYQNSGGSLGVSSYTSHFEIEVVE